LLFLSELCETSHSDIAFVIMSYFNLLVLLLLSGRYAACVCSAEVDDMKEARGRLFSWGYGGHGNLGLGDRRDRVVPEAVTGQVCPRTRPFVFDWTFICHRLGIERQRF
jgi:hypothetical protein